MWWRRMRFTLGYMAREVTIKGAISGALWIMYWYLVETVVNEGASAYIGMLFVGGFGVVFGAFIGAITGAAVGGVYVAANAVFLRDDMHLPFYRLALVAIGGLLTLLSWAPFWLASGSLNFWMPFSGGVLAAVGVGASAYTYLPDYIERVRYGRLYDPYDRGLQPHPEAEDPFA